MNDVVRGPFDRPRRSFFVHRREPGEGALAIEPEDLGKDCDADTVASERSHGAERVRVLGDGDGPEALHIGCRLLDGPRVILRPLGRALPHHTLDPRHEPVPSGDLSAQRRELHVRVRVHEGGKQDPGRAFDMRSSVPR